MTERKLPVPVDGSARAKRLKPEERRRIALDAATRRFAASGYEVAMSEIAAMAGVRRSVMYHYFPTKKDLYLTVVELQLNKLFTGLEPLTEVEGSAEDRLRAVLRAMVVFAKEERDAWDILFAPPPSGADAAVVEMSCAVRTAARLAVTGLLSGEATRVDVDLGSRSIEAMIEFALGGLTAAVRWWREQDDVSDELLSEALFTMVWFGAGGIYYKTVPPPTP